MAFRARSTRLLALLVTGSAFAIGGLLALPGCTKAYRQSLGTNEGEIYNRIYLTDFNIGWQSTLDALKASPMDVTNREGGFLQSKWVDNTAQKNFTESFGSADSYQKAQYRFRVTVAKGFYNGRPSIKVAVQKEQLVQRDVLEGFRPIETDGTDERTLLYRIGRIIYMRTRLASLEEEKIRRNLDPSGSGAAAGPGAGSGGPGASNGSGTNRGAAPPLPMDDALPSSAPADPTPPANDPELDGPNPGAFVPTNRPPGRSETPPANSSALPPDPNDMPMNDMPEPPPPPAKQLNYRRR